MKELEINKKFWKVLAEILLVFFFIVLLRTAWISDDGFITLRVVDNFIKGNGPVWNVGNRVQAYTHPLWFLIISFFYSFTKEGYYTTIFISIALSLITVYLIAFKLTKKNYLLGALLLLGLIFSKSFTDYSTSGLENPLSHLLIVIFYWAYTEEKFNHKTLLLTLISSLIIVTRQDLLLMVIPALIFIYLKEKSSILIKLKTALIGFSPFILWTIFSLIYYGFPFPNTAYAKLNSIVPAKDLIGQGLYYLLNSINLDAITLLIVAISVIIFLYEKKKSYIPIIVGNGLYLIYIIKIGADFMSGRFLSAIFVSSIVLIALELRDKRIPLNFYYLAAFSIIGLGLLSPANPVQSDVNYPDYPLFKDSKPEFKLVEDTDRSVADGMLISDERAFYYHGTGLLKVTKFNKNGHMPLDGWYTNGIQLKKDNVKYTEAGAIGLLGYGAGPSVNIVDNFGLADALVARIPSGRSVSKAKGENIWRPGHMYREIPCGYQQSIETNSNKICDSSLAVYYDKIDTITTGKIFTVKRFKTIILMNLGKYNYLMDEYQKHI